ncbi:MAG: hypothetical protein ACJ780_24900 [Solirubrobacteraceae bacterium]
MAVLLRARGFSVTPSARYPDQMTAVTRALETVIIDAEDSLVSAEAAAVQAGLVTPGRTIVFVIDSGQPTTMAAPVFRKWGPLERLCDEIASARPQAGGRP